MLSWAAGGGLNISWCGAKDSSREISPNSISTCATGAKKRRWSGHGPTPLHRRFFAPVAQLEMFRGEIPAGESFAPHHEMLSPEPVRELNMV